MTSRKQFIPNGGRKRTRSYLTTTHLCVFVTPSSTKIGCNDNDNNNI